MTLLTADCLPIAIAATGGERLALLHAGWRGLVAGIAEAGVKSVGGPLCAAVGPGAGPCCYEVGEEVAVALRDCFGPDVVQDGRADLWLCARRALERAGAAGVEVACECTICHPGRYFSHRRDAGITGFSHIGLCTCNHAATLCFARLPSPSPGCSAWLPMSEW